MGNNKIPIENIDNNNKNLDITKVLVRSLKYWYILLICLIISTTLGLYEFRTSLPKYQISALLLISDDDASNVPVIGGGTTGNTQGAGLPGVSIGKYSKVDNQIVILTSTKQLSHILDKPEYKITYYEKQTFLTPEIYKETPFLVKQDSIGNKKDVVKYQITFIDDKRFKIFDVNNPEKVETHKLFENFNLSNNIFKIIPNKEKINKHKYIGKTYFVRFNALPFLINKYKKNFSINLFKKGSSIYQISIKENNIHKGKDFINALAKSAVAYDLDKKNQVANNTIHFIERQLTDVSDSLSAAESVLESFRSRNKVMDVSMQGQMIITTSQELENQKAVLVNYLNYYKYLEEYLLNSRNVQELNPPTTLGETNPALTNIIGELTLLNAEKSSLEFNSKAENPGIKRINRIIDTKKKAIIEMVKSSINHVEMEIKTLNNRLMKLSNKIKRLPKTEQTLAGFNRTFKLNDEMYTYLLQRRSEAEMAKASNVSNNEIIENAELKGQVSPNLIKILIMVIVMGFILPYAIIFIILISNNKILEIETIEEITGTNILGILPKKSKKGNADSLITNPNSILAEGFRTIRTALDFYKDENNNKTILLTSSIPSEGKSFCSFNLAVSYAQLGKKTVLLGFDLRKPKLSDYIEINSKNAGISKFLATSEDDDMKIDEIIQSTNITNLDVIPPGEIPPNPAELIAQNKTDIFFSELKKKYEIIIIDTSPIGLVTDANLLEKYTNVNIMVMRYNRTPIKLVSYLFNSPKVQQLKNLAVIYNGTPAKNKSYSYHYGYKGYYTSD